MYWYIYGGIDIFVKNEFVISLIISYIPFGFLLKKRRKLFWLRSFISFVVMLVISNLYCYFTENAPLAAVAKMFYFPLILTVFMLSGIFIYKNSVWNILFCGFGMYSLQHATNRIYTVILGYVEYACHLPVWVYAIVYWLFFVAADIIVYYLYLRKRDRYGELQTNDKALSVFVAALILSNIVLSGLPAFWVSIAQAREIDKVNILNIIAMLSCILNILIINYLFNNASSTKLETDIVRIKQLWEEDRKQYDLSKQYIEQINIKYHDLKYALNSALKNDSHLEEISECIKQYDTFIKTGNETLDVLINEKSMLCKGFNIQLACIADGEIISHLNAVDLYSLLGNALDNAVEAVKDFSDEDKKYIEIMIHRSGDMALISVENPIVSKPVFKRGLPQTTKSDTVNHGYGLKSMKMIVEKYKGYMDIDTNDNTFSLRIALPILK